MNRLLTTSALALALAGCASKGEDPSTQVGPDPKLPGQNQYLLPPMRIATPAAWNGQLPKAAPGLRVEAYASGFKNVRSVYALPNGDVLAVEPEGPQEPIARPKDIVVNWIQGFGHSKTKGADRITLLRDTDGDGKPDVRTVFLDHLVSPFGVVLVGGDLYVANTDAIVRFPYLTGQTRITAPGSLVTDLPGGPIDHHWTKSLTASPDGAKLYVGIGSNSNITENGIEAEKDRARIWEVDRATGAHRPYATGLRNPNGLTFLPGTNQLWTVVNERDELGPDLVPDYLTSVTPGAFYGWPWSYWGQHVDPRVKPERMEMVKRAILPDYSLGSHVAPLGLAFGTLGAYTGAFVGEHGSWDRGHFNGYKVAFIPFRGGKPAGSPRDLLAGFLDGDGHTRGRPVGVAFDRAGALLVADDLSNTIWRVTAG